MHGTGTDVGVMESTGTLRETAGVVDAALPGETFAEAPVVKESSLAELRLVTADFPAADATEAAVDVSTRVAAGQLALAVSDEGRGREDEVRVPIQVDEDIVTARQKGRSLAAELNFTSGEAILIATVISELARNIVMYAKTGEIRLKVINGGSARHGIQVIARDEGPGIADVDQALRDGFSTSGSLGVGLPGVRRLVDEFQIDSTENRGTTVTVMKRKRPAVADRR